MFLTLLLLIISISFLLICIGLIVIPILVIWDNAANHKEQGDAVFIGIPLIITGIAGLLFALAIFTGEISFSNNDDVPKQGCWYVTTTRELVGKTTQDVRHWESISCP